MALGLGGAPGAGAGALGEGLPLGATAWPLSPAGTGQSTTRGLAGGEGGWRQLTSRVTAGLAASAFCAFLPFLLSDVCLPGYPRRSGLV